MATEADVGAPGAALNASRRWRVTGLVEFPFCVQQEADGLAFLSRIPEGIASLGSVSFRISACPDRPAFAFPRIHPTHPETWARVACEVDAPSEASCVDAVEAISDGLDHLLDVLSFQMQIRLRVAALHAIDVTPPVSVGELRDCGVWPYPDGYASFKELSARDSSVNARVVPLLPRRTAELGQAQAIAMQWYLKALAEPSAPNRYISLWIALEALINASGVQQTHKKRGNGAQARAFLEASGVKPHVAADFWRARNIVHGSQAFDSQVMQSLPILASHLMAVVTTYLKLAVGIPADEPPIVVPGAFAAGGFMFDGGQAEVEAGDVD